MFLVSVPLVGSCAPRRKFSSVGKLQKKTSFPLHPRGIDLTFKPSLGVSCVGNEITLSMMITLSCTSTFYNKSISSEHTSPGLSVSSSKNGTYEEKKIGSVSTSSFFNIVNVTQL